MWQSTISKNLQQLDGCYFKYKNLPSLLSNKPRINFSTVKNECVLIGQGCNAKVYLYKKLNICIKVIKGNPNLDQIIREIMIMTEVNSIWPDLFQYLVIDDKSSVVGFSMKYFQGKKIWEAYRDPDNIYFNNPASRIRLVKKVKQVVKKLQQLRICHGDMHIDNIMIKQSNKASQECEILIIDYGAAFIMDDYAIQRPQLTGWAFMKPSQAKTGYFYDTAGLNSYMLGRVALQILLLQSYDDYSHFRDQSPERELEILTSLGFHPTVREEIQIYLDKDFNVRNKMLEEQSTMKQVMRDNPTNQSFQPDKQKYGWSLVNLIKTGHYDETYYVRNPEKLGYKNQLKQSQPNYQAQSQPNYQPQSQPNYQPQSQPNYQPQSQPNYQSQSQQNYQSQSQQNYQSLQQLYPELTYNLRKY